MGIKIIILVLFAGLVLSLFSGLLFLFRDRGTTKRTVSSLGIRLAFAAALMTVLIYGLYNGSLGSRAPWEMDTHGERSQNVDK